MTSEGLRMQWTPTPSAPSEDQIFVLQMMTQVNTQAAAA
jgi:hypothetical protein